VTLEILLDLLLVGTVIVVATRAVRAQSLFLAVSLYIAFGLLLSLVWVRLRAPDLALAEAAIGAGITGALLMGAAGQLGARRTGRSRSRPVWSLAAAGASLGLVLTLAVAFLSLADRTLGLGSSVFESLPGSGVDHPVTAVLLNFRAYDTWLELGVLLVAALALLALRKAREVPAEVGGGVLDPVTSGVVSLLTPIAILVAGYLLLRGTYAPGGAFQAGAVIGATGVLLVMTGRLPPRLLQGRSLRALLLTGFALFLLGGLVGPASGGSFLEFPPAIAGTAILLIEVGATVSIAATLALLYAGSRPVGGANGGAEAR